MQHQRSPLRSAGAARTWTRRARGGAARAARWLGCASVALWAGACHTPLDTARDEPIRATFGDDLYGVLCDRLGASVLSEDLDGASYQGICHYDAQGRYADTVDVSGLPSPAGERAVEARRLSVAKLERLAARRSELVRAFNAAFPDVDIPDPTTSDPADTVRLLDALMVFSQNLSPLYEENPYDSAPYAEPLAPATTRALGKLFDALAESGEAREMLSRIWGRQGYRPSDVGLGAVRSTLAYPELRDFTLAAVGHLGPDGEASEELQRLLAAAEMKLAYLEPDVQGLAPFSVDAARAQPTRPRETIELLRDLMVAEDPRFADRDDVPRRYISLRDGRGFVLPAASGNALPAPFVDLDGDGLADVDPSGRFVDQSGAPLALDTPFAVPGVALSAPPDAFGRPTGAPYRYVDTSRTLTHALTNRLAPLVDATRYASPDDPEAYKLESEALMYAVAGLGVLMGPREEAEYDFENDQVVPKGTGCASCLPYERFRGEDSPLADLMHALGQVLADDESDVLMQGLIELFENHEPEMARLVAASLRVKEIADEHDALAEAGGIPAAGLPYENPIWDQAARVLSKIADEPGLVTNVVAALGDPTIVTPVGSVSHMGESIARFASLRDQMTYDVNAINGPARNLTAGGSSVADPSAQVDVNAPRVGNNRSLLERSVLLIHDASGARACNRNGAKVKARVAGISLDWPLTGSYDACELFEIPNLAAFYFGALMPPSHPKRSRFVLKDGALNSIMNLVGSFVSADQMFQDSSGITGMTTRPTPAALNRLVYFGASSTSFPNMPDFDAVNAGGRTDGFISALMDPVPTSVCPTNAQGVANCAMEDLIRLRTRNSIFPWERFGFLDYMRPVLTPFVNVSCSADLSICDTEDFRGEELFLELANVFYWHYAGPDHGSECNGSGTPETNPRYCSGAGLNRYEPIIDKSMRTDLIPALNEFAAAAHDVARITIARGPRAGQTVRGSEVLEIATKILFSQSEAAKVAMADRSGNRQARWTDGSTQSQTTPFHLFADALHGFDEAFAAAEDGAERQARWRRARSKMVDVFLATDGSGENTRFKSRATAPMLAAVLKIVREQVNARCPTREAGNQCAWGRKDLGVNTAEFLSGPLVAALVDLLEAIRSDEPARRATGRFLTHLLSDVGTGEGLVGTLASLNDVLQVMSDEEKLYPVLRAASIALQPVEGPVAGCAERTIRLLKALTDDAYDEYHVLDHVLRNLVTPMPDGSGAPQLSPLEVMMDVIADVHRLDASSEEPLAEADYAAIMGTVRDFLVDETRGLEQIYAIVRRRQRP